MKKLLGIDLGLTGFYTIIEIDDDNNFTVLLSSSIEIENRSEKVLKKGNSEPIIKNQISFLKNRDKISKIIDKDTICLFEQITTRNENSKITSMSLSDSSAVFRCLCESLNINYFIIPPANWKKFIGVTSDKKTSLEYFKNKINSNEIKIKDDFKVSLKKLNHNMVESVLICYFYFLSNIKNK